RFGFGQELEAAHARHIDVGQNQYERARIADALKRCRRRLGKFHRKATGPKVAAELLTKQHFNVGLIINNKDKKFHADAPVLPSVTAFLGRTIRNSVY